MGSEKHIKKLNKGNLTKLFILLLCIFFSTFTIVYIAAVTLLPGEITLLEGEEYNYHLGVPFPVSIHANKDGAIRLNGDHLGNKKTRLNLMTPVSIVSSGLGNVLVEMKLYGLLPLKTVKVDVIPNIKVVPCGNTVGVRIQTKGILVIAVSDVEVEEGVREEPAKDAGIRVGDIILEINNQEVRNVDELLEKVAESQGNRIAVKYQRGNEIRNTMVVPSKSIETGKYHLGLWVRDSTAGIGTLTFYDPDSLAFGALGHGITDVDTGLLLKVGSGELLQSSILSVKKGQRGKPGELKGLFMESLDKMGTIYSNTEYGIYGVINKDVVGSMFSEAVPIALRNQVKEGPAVIRANVEGNRVEEYTIEIQKVIRQNASSSKGMIIKVTDQRLLEKTGGIVQGMSGSPILQNGKLIGAVTHVLVNDPTKGYGIFIEWMMKNALNQNMEYYGTAG